VRETDEHGNDVLRAIFLHDNFARGNKQGGAWMSEYRTQTRNIDEMFVANNSHIIRDGNVIPIIVNNNNFAKASNGQTLLSYDDARTLFHEFGHGLHGMLSNVTYERLAGTSVLRDFVELPSQLYEHWLGEEVVLKKHARHFETNEPIPDELVNKLKLAHAFNKGFETIEYVSSALIDQALHSLSSIDETTFNINQFEQAELAKIDMPAGMVMRHRPTHFLHLFASSSYAAAYYVYLWAEVLDADGFDTFKESGDVFNKDVAHRVRKFIYSAGNSIEPGEAYRRFRGRDPIVEPMLRKKALM
jgi:peptidyl-dipeptidase Dcp